MEVLDPSSSLTLRQALCTWTSGGSFLRASAILLPWASKLFLLYVGGTLKSEHVSFLSPNGNRCVRASLQDSVPKLSPCLIPGYRWLPPLLILSSSALSLGPVVKGFLPFWAADCLCVSLGAKLSVWAGGFLLLLQGQMAFCLYLSLSYSSLRDILSRHSFMHRYHATKGGSFRSPVMTHLSRVQLTGGRPVKRAYSECILFLCLGHQGF